VTLWDITAGKLFGKFKHHNADCRSVEFSSDNKWLISASFDNSIGIVDMNHNQTFKIEPHDDKVVSAKWHPYLPILLSTGADRTARVLAP